MLRTLKSTLFDISFANPALFLVTCVWYSFVQFLIFNLVLLLCFSCSTIYSWVLVSTLACSSLRFCQDKSSDMIPSHFMGMIYVLPFLSTFLLVQANYYLSPFCLLISNFS